MDTIHIALDELENGYTVSTILLGRHPNKFKFETMVFHDSTGAQEVYATRNESEAIAMETHVALVEDFALKQGHDGKFLGYGKNFSLVP